MNKKIIVGLKTFFSNYFFEKKETCIDSIGQTLVVGNRVVPTANQTLYCGFQEYYCAIVVQLNPFVMVSEQGDVRWGSWKPKNVISIGSDISQEKLKLCMEKL